MKPTQREERRGASILLLSIVFMVILLLLSTTLFQIIPAEMHAANRSHENLNAHMVARAGITDALKWLEFKMGEFETSNNESDLPDFNSGTVASPVYPNIQAYETAVQAKRPFAGNGDWRYECEIVPQQDTKTLTNNLEVRYFAIRSTAFKNNRPIRRMDVLVQQNSFALYAFLSKEWDPDSVMILTGENAFQGPVHTDDFWNFDASALDANGWDDTQNIAFFGDLVSHGTLDPNAPVGGDGNRWTGGEPYDANGAITGRYEQVFQDGRDDLRQKNTVTLPSTTAGALTATWPDANSLPTTDGAYVSRDANGVVDGGLLVEGDANFVNLRLDQYGNQKIVVGQTPIAGSKSVQKWKWVSYNPKKYYTCNKCVKWGPPSGGGGGGGAGGGGLNNVCIQYASSKCESRQKVPNGTTNQTDRDPLETHIYEVTEAPVTVQDENGNDVTANVGQTLILTQMSQQETDDSGGFVVQGVEVLDGQINGNIYVDGNLGREGRRSDYSYNGQREAGLWGIAKGSVATDANGTLQTNGDGSYKYNNKAIVTPLDKRINLGGDLLQFDQTRFEAARGPDPLNPAINFESKSGGGGDDKVRNWAEFAALDPQAAGGPELSPSNDHVLGIITRDLWMAGPKNNSGNWRKELTGNDGESDIYAVALAGTEILSDPNDPSSGVGDGGFGTFRYHRDSIGDGLGKFNIIGGVIQGTEGTDPGDYWKDTHHWVDESGSVGYDVKMFYDPAATKQRLFPLEKTFGIIRVFESTARQ